MTIYACKFCRNTLKEIDKDNHEYCWRGYSPEFFSNVRKIGPFIVMGRKATVEFMEFMEARKNV